MKKRLLSLMLVLCMLMACLPAALAADDRLAYRELKGSAREGWKEDSRTPLTTDGVLKIETTGAAKVALYAADETTKVQHDEITVPDGLKVIPLEESGSGAVIPGYYKISFKDITTSADCTITYGNQSLVVRPVQPEYGFYTDSACDLSHLVEEYEIQDSTTATTLYFYQNTTKPDYSNIAFEIGQLSLSDKKYTAEDTNNGIEFVKITVPAGTSGTLEAINSDKETLAEVELEIAGQSTTPTFSLCTLENGRYTEVGRTITLPRNYQTLTLYMVENGETAVKVVGGVSDFWTVTAGDPNAVSWKVITKTVGDETFNEIILTRNNNNAFTGTLKVSNHDGYTCEVEISFDGVPAADTNAPKGFSYRVADDKTGTNLGSYCTGPLEVTYGESTYVALYFDGVAIEDDDAIDADGVDCNLSSKSSIFKIVAERTESGIISYTDQGTTYELQVKVETPETGFFSIPERDLTYYLEDLDVLNPQTTIYFFGAKPGDTVTFSVKPVKANDAQAGALTVSLASTTAGSDPIAVTLTDKAASADNYGKMGFHVCVEIKDSGVEELLQVKRSDDYGKASAYDFYSFQNGQYDLLDQLKLKKADNGKIAGAAYLRKSSGAAFTQDELNELRVTFTMSGNSQNEVTLTSALTKDGAIAVTATLKNGYNIEGTICVNDSAGKRLTDLWLDYTSKIHGNGKIEFTFNNEDYTIGFVDGAESGGEQYLSFIGGIWARNSELNDSEPEKDSFYLGIALSDGDEPEAQPALYKTLIDSVTFTMLDANAGTQIPKYTMGTHTKGWDMVTIYTYLKNAGPWVLQADIKFSQPVGISERGTGVIWTDTIELTMTFKRTLVPEIGIDLREDANGNPLDALKTVQAYIDLLKDTSGVDTLKTSWTENGHRDWAETLANPKAEIWFTLPAKCYVGDLVADKLMRQIGVIGTQNEVGEVTTIQGSVYRTNEADNGTLALSDLHLEGKGKNVETYLDNSQTRPNYGVYSAGGNIEFEGCTFEGYWAAVWDAPLPGSNVSKQDMVSLFGGNRNVFLNNKYGVYTDSYKMDGTANKPAVMRSTFQGNEWGIYIASLSREGYKYNVKFCKFLDNSCDIYYGFTHRVFFPSNYFGQTVNGPADSRDPIVRGRNVTVVVGKSIGANGNVVRQYANIDTEDLVTLDPILLDADFDQGGNARLGVSAGTSSFAMLNNVASALKIDAASLTNRASDLSINMVDQDTTSTDNGSSDKSTPEVVGSTTTLGTWNIAVK